MASLLKFFSAKLGKKSRDSRDCKSRTARSVFFTSAQPSAELDTRQDPSEALVQLRARYDQLERSCGRLSKAYAELYKENESLKASQDELRTENHKLRKAYGGDVKREECAKDVKSGMAKNVDHLRELLHRASAIVNDWEVVIHAQVSQHVTGNDEKANRDEQSLASGESFELVDECAAENVD